MRFFFFFRPYFIRFSGNRHPEPGGKLPSKSRIKRSFPLDVRKTAVCNTLQPVRNIVHECIKTAHLLQCVRTVVLNNFPGNALEHDPRSNVRGRLILI